MNHPNPSEIDVNHPNPSEIDVYMLHGVCFFAAGDDDEYFDFGSSEIETSTKDALTHAQQKIQQAAQKQAQIQDTTMRRANTLSEDSLQNLAVSPGGGGWFRPTTRGVSGVSGMVAWVSWVAVAWVVDVLHHMHH